MIYFHTDNNMQKILPFGEPPLKGYPYYGAFFGIVDAYTKNYLEWIYNYFMQLYVANNHDMGMRVDFSTPKIEKTLPWIEVEKIERLFYIIYLEVALIFIKMQLIIINIFLHF